MENIEEKVTQAVEAIARSIAAAEGDGVKTVVGPAQFLVKNFLINQQRIADSLAIIAGAHLPNRVEEQK